MIVDKKGSVVGSTKQDLSRPSRTSKTRHLPQPSIQTVLAVLSNDIFRIVHFYVS